MSASTKEDNVKRNASVDSDVHSPSQGEPVDRREEFEYVDPRSRISTEKKPWELWIEAHTPYRVKWWHDTWREPFMIRMKLGLVFIIMLMIPTALFVGIDWWYGDGTAAAEGDGMSCMNEKVKWVLFPRHFT